MKRRFGIKNVINEMMIKRQNYDYYNILKKKQKKNIYEK